MSSIRTNAPYRADIVGSFLRPAELKEARQKFVEGKIDASALKAIEDRLITDLIAKQKAHGLKVITDGEFRRSYWHLDFMWGLNGIEEIELDHGYQFHGEETTRGSIALSGRISGEKHAFVEHFKFVKQFEEEGVTARQTIPAPAQLFAELFRGDNTKNTLKYYPDIEVLIEDIAKAYRQVIVDLYAAGCRNIQFDDCTWGMVVDKNYWKAHGGDKETLDDLAKKYLKYIPNGKQVVLGLITTKRPELENSAEIVARISDAELYIPHNDLCLSPQCGFASCEIGNKLTEEEQWAKIDLVQEIAAEVWGK